MPTVAEQLRLAREEMKLDTHQVAEATKLKTDHIRALEEGDHDYFTAPIYLRGSLRTYSGLLKLDTAQLLAQLETELGASKKFSDNGPVPAKRKGVLDSIMLLLSRLNWAVAAVLVGLAVIALAANASYRAWKGHKAADPLKKLGSGLYQPGELSGETLPLPTGGNPKVQSPNPR